MSVAYKIVYTAPRVAIHVCRKYELQLMTGKPFMNLAPLSPMNKTSDLLVWAV